MYAVTRVVAVVVFIVVVVVVVVVVVFIVAVVVLPLVLTLGTNSFSSHSRSEMTSVAGFPPMWALTKSGTWVVEWLPQMQVRVTAL